MENQRVGRVIRSLPDKRVVIEAGGKLITATAHGLVPRPGMMALIGHTGRNWAVISWQ